MKKIWQKVFVGSLAFTIATLLLAGITSNSIIMSISILGIGVSVIIFDLIPTFIAFEKKHKDRTIILVIDILFGWTLIGWIICLFWANSETKENKDINNNKYEDIAKLQKLKETGAITEEEFNTEKQKLLK